MWLRGYMFLGLIAGSKKRKRKRNIMREKYFQGICYLCVYEKKEIEQEKSALIPVFNILCLERILLVRCIFLPSDVNVSHRPFQEKMERLKVTSTGKISY